MLLVDVVLVRVAPSLCVVRPAHDTIKRRGHLQAGARCVVCPLLACKLARLLGVGRVCACGRQLTQSGRAQSRRTWSWGRLVPFELADLWEPNWRLAVCAPLSSDPFFKLADLPTRLPLRCSPGQTSDSLVPRRAASLLSHTCRRPVCK